MAFTAFTTHLRKLDWVLVTVVFLLAGIGLLSIYSSSIGKNDFSNFQKQIIFLAVGLFLMFLISLLDYRILKNDPYLILILYFICLFALAGLFFFAPEIRGVKSWYKLGFFSFNPIEFTKIILIILLAKYFSSRHVEMYRIHHILLSGIYVALPSILLFLQPELGSALILIALWIAILLVSGIKLRHFFILIFVGILMCSLGWSFLLRDYQKTRLISFITPQVEPLKAGWNQTQAKIAIGSGGILGRGLGQGSQTQLGFLPELQTDFIFASIAEEFGLAGAAIMLILFLVLIWRIIKIALASSSNFSYLFSFGLSTLLVIQTVINIGMNLGLLPVIGIPLPLVSYGGSALIASFIGLGVLQSIKSHSRRA